MFVYCKPCGVQGNFDHPPGDGASPMEHTDHFETRYDGEPGVLENRDRSLNTAILWPKAVFGPNDPGPFLPVQSNTQGANLAPSPESGSMRSSAKRLTAAAAREC
jgi:hypothetical protein